MTVAEYQQSTQRLENAINRLADRNNSLQSDLQGYDRQVSSTLSSTRRNVAREKTAINKLRDEVRSQSMFNLLINFLTIQKLQQDLKESRGDDFVYYVFDLLYLDGQDLTSAPLEARKEVLAALIGGGFRQLPGELPRARVSISG